MPRRCASSQPFQLPVEEVEPLDIGDDRRLSRLVRRFEIGGIQRAAHTMIGDQLIHPGEAVEVVPVKLARCRRSHHSEGPFRAATDHRPVRHVRQAGDRQRSDAHRLCEITARRCLRRDTGGAAMAMDVDGNGVSQDGECRRCGRGGLRRCRRTVRPDLAGEHRPDRDQRLAPHPGLGCRDVVMTTTIHGILSAIAIALA